MNNTPNKFTTTANNVEATANFINKVAQSKINNTADKYDFSWHGGASKNFHTGSGNYGKSEGGFGKSSGGFSRTSSSASSATQSTVNQRKIATQSTRSGDSATVTGNQNTVAKQQHTYTSNKFSTGSKGGKSTSMPAKSGSGMQSTASMSKTAPSSGAANTTFGQKLQSSQRGGNFASPTNPIASKQAQSYMQGISRGGIHDHGGSVASYTSDKFSASAGRETSGNLTHALQDSRYSIGGGSIEGRYSTAQGKAARVNPYVTNRYVNNERAVNPSKIRLSGSLANDSKADVTNGMPSASRSHVTDGSAVSTRSAVVDGLPVSRSAVTDGIPGSVKITNGVIIKSPNGFANKAKSQVISDEGIRSLKRVRGEHVSKASIHSNTGKYTVYERDLQTGAYTRVSTGARVAPLQEAGKGIVSLATRPVEDAQAVQGIRETKQMTQRVSSMSGLGVMSKAAVRRAANIDIKTSLYKQNPKFSVDDLNLSSVGGKDRSAEYRVTASSNVRRDLANNKKVLEDHFKDLKLDVRSLDTIRINRLIKGETVGIGGKKYSLANAKDRQILAEYKKLAGLDRKAKLGTGAPMSGLRNMGKAWVNTFYSDSEAVQGLKATTSAYKAGKVSIKAGATATKATVVAGMRTLGTATAAASLVPKAVGKVGMAMTKSSLAKARWGSISNLGASIDKASKVMINGAGKLSKFTVKGTLNNAKFKVGRSLSTGVNGLIGKSARLTGLRNKLGLFNKRIQLFRTKLLNSRITKVVVSPFKMLISLFSGFKKFLVLAGMVLFGGAIIIIIVAAILLSFAVTDTQYDGDDTTPGEPGGYVGEDIDDTVLQGAIDYIHGMQNSYEYNLFACDANLPEEQRAVDEFSGVAHWKRGLPSRWKEQMLAWMGKGINAEDGATVPGEGGGAEGYDNRRDANINDYSNYITAVYEYRDGQPTDNLVGFNMLNYWGPESHVYKYSAKQYGAETHKGYNGGFCYFAKKPHKERDADGNEYELPFPEYYDLVKVYTPEYDLVGIGSLEKDAGTYSVNPTETHMPAGSSDYHKSVFIDHDSEAYAYNGAGRDLISQQRKDELNEKYKNMYLPSDVPEDYIKQINEITEDLSEDQQQYKINTDVSVKYLYRGSEYVDLYTINKKTSFQHIDREQSTSYSMQTFYKNMVALATGYTGNAQEKQGDFYRDFMMELFNQNCNGKTTDAVKNEYTERGVYENKNEGAALGLPDYLVGKGIYREVEGNVNNMPTYAKISIGPRESPSVSNKEKKSPVDNDRSYFVEDNSAEAGKRRNIYYAGPAEDTDDQGTGIVAETLDSGEIVGDGKEVHSLDDAALKWTYKDSLLNEVYDSQDEHCKNLSEVNEWVDDQGYDQQWCWSRSCETYPVLSISFFYTGVPDMVYLLDVNDVVTNGWSHKGG